MNLIHIMYHVIKYFSLHNPLITIIILHCIYGLSMFNLLWIEVSGGGVKIRTLFDLLWTVVSGGGVKIRTLYQLLPRNIVRMHVLQCLYSFENMSEIAHILYLFSPKDNILVFSLFSTEQLCNGLNNILIL